MKKEVKIENNKIEPKIEMKKVPLTNEQFIKRATIEASNFDNVGKILNAEKDILNNFIKNRKPILNREQKDIMGVQLSNLNNALLVVLHHINGRVTELNKIIDKKTEELKVTSENKETKVVTEVKEESKNA